jgi:isopentenyldiphosphate isomerase
MEYIDILDEKGNKTGKVKSKSDVHRDGDWHRTVHVWFINSKEEILLQLRSKYKETHPNCWDISAAGHMSSGEDSITSAMREIEEELGITINPNELNFIGTVTQHKFLDNNIINYEFNDVYIVKADLDLSTLKLQEKEVNEVKYLPKEEFKKWVQEKRSDLVSHAEEYELLFKNIN